MTNARVTEAFVYTIRTLTLKEEVEEEWRLSNPRTRRTELTSADYNVIETPYVVPNGMWVLEGYDEDWFVHQRFVGDQTKIERIDLDRSVGKILWVSEEPFGTLRWERDRDCATSLPTGGIHFSSAKQIHKGQPGQLVSIPKLKYVREDKPEVREWAQGKRKFRSHVGWGKVSDLVATTKLSFEEIIERFWPFVDYNHQPWHRFPATLKMLRDVNAEQIKNRDRTVEQLTKQEILDALQEDPDAYNDAWIPAGLSKTILRLIVLGYQPVGVTINA